MHELGLLYETARMVARVAEENGITKVAVVSVDVGELTGVLPDVFTDYYPYVAEQFPVIEDSRLELRMIPGEGECDDCKRRYNIMACEGKCPSCGSAFKTILSGQGMTLREIKS